ncbi:hypothetical protein [Streptomyces sp. NPDC006739]|uniref:hypothetical protein n=1 Tax=Streptomyces sp. NPDC006739 TaxID=3364763 RepID=UPI0036B2EFBE
MGIRPTSPATSRVRAQRALVKRKRTRTSLVSLLLVLLLTTVTLGCFGIEDFGHALTFPGRITGAVLICVSVATLLGAAGALDHWFWNSFPYSGLVALVGAFAAVLTNFLLLAEIVKGGDSAAYRALFCALAAGSLWAVVAVWRTSVVIPAPKRVTMALLVSSVLAIANFGYQNLYQPSQREVRPVIRLAMGSPVTSKDGKAFSLPVDITVENHSDVGFYVLGTEFHAMGERVPLSAKDRLRQQWRVDSEQWSKFEEYNPVSRREIHQPGELVDAQPWMPYGRWIDASDTFSSRVVVQLPMDAPYDQVAFYASASLARKDRITLRNLHFKTYSWNDRQLPRWVEQQKDWDSLVFQGEIDENNAIDQHTRNRRYMFVYWRFGTHGAGIEEAISTPHGKDASLEEAEDRYGVRDVKMGPVERTLWDIKSQR